MRRRLERKLVDCLVGRCRCALSSCTLPPRDGPGFSLSKLSVEKDKRARGTKPGSAAEPGARDGCGGLLPCEGTAGIADAGGRRGSFQAREALTLRGRHRTGRARLWSLWALIHGPRMTAPERRPSGLYRASRQYGRDRSAGRLLFWARPSVILGLDHAATPPCKARGRERWEPARQNWRTCDRWLQ